MITATPEPITAVAEDGLKKWFLAPGFETARRVIKARVQECECKAIFEAREGDKFPAKLDVANEHLRNAQRYQNALDVLKELAEQQTPYTTAKLT